MKKKDKFFLEENSAKASCKLKKALTLPRLAVYGSLVVLFLQILIQIFNIVSDTNLLFSYISIFFNLFFLLVILQKIEYINIKSFDKFVVPSLRFLIFLYLTNFCIYMFYNSVLYSYLIALINFFGAYFIFLLIKREFI